MQFIARDLYFLNVCLMLNVVTDDILYYDSLFCC